MSEPHDWSWTNQLFLISYDDSGDKDEFLIRARSCEEAVRLFATRRIESYFRWSWDHVGDQVTNTKKIAREWKNVLESIEYIIELPTQPGLTGILNWHGDGRQTARSHKTPELIPPTTITLETEEE